MASKSSDGVVILLNREILREGEESEAARGVAGYVGVEYLFLLLLSL